MSKVKQIGEIILEIAADKEYENSAIAQWFNKKENNERSNVIQR